MTITPFRALPEVDRLLAIALQIYEDGRCGECGQQVSASHDPDLADEWATSSAVRCYSCYALAQQGERDKGAEHPGTLRYMVGLREGWEDRLAAARAERAASNHPDQRGDE